MRLRAGREDTKDGFGFEEAKKTQHREISLKRETKNGRRVIIRGDSETVGTKEKGSLQQCVFA